MDEDTRLAKVEFLVDNLKECKDNMESWLEDQENDISTIKESLPVLNTKIDQILEALREVKKTQEKIRADLEVAKSDAKTSSVITSSIVSLLIGVSVAISGILFKSWSGSS